ncbi:MAG: hypothetical protein JW990_04985, partial [Thermoleophilia bacterium]|nr:hypothetical protein [Thermoleophilia bacterium]
MRAAPSILGILGGLAGLSVHAVLLARFFSQSYGLFQTFLELLLALVLGLAALLVAAIWRRSAKTLAVFLPVLGVLGFFPRPLSWIPAGVLLAAAGVVACVTALHRSDAGRLGAPA